MKKMITLAAMLLATSAFAHTWTEILSNPRLEAKLPSVKLATSTFQLKLLLFVLKVTF